MGHNRLRDAAILNFGKIISCVPFRSIAFTEKGQLSDLKGFKQGAAILEVFVANFIKVMQALIEGQIVAPVIRIALEL